MLSDQAINEAIEILSQEMSRLKDSTSSYDSGVRAGLHRAINTLIMRKQEHCVPKKPKTIE